MLRSAPVQVDRGGKAGNFASQTRWRGSHDRGRRPSTYRVPTGAGPTSRLQFNCPTVSEQPEFAEDGGLLSYGPSIFTAAQRQAQFVDRILKGANPADLPVEQPAKFDLDINLKTAKALGITIPELLLIQADKVIE